MPLKILEAELVLEKILLIITDEDCDFDVEMFTWATKEIEKFYKRHDPQYYNISERNSLMIIKKNIDELHSSSPNLTKEEGFALFFYWLASVFFLLVRGYENRKKFKRFWEEYVEPPHWPSISTERYFLRQRIPYFTNMLIELIDLSYYECPEEETMWTLSLDEVNAIFHAIQWDQDVIENIIKLRCY